MIASLYQQLYGITPERTDDLDLFHDVELALSGGLRWLQYRDKSSAPEQKRKRARQLRAMTRAADAVLIINDSIDLCLDVAADGVHLGLNDCALDEARHRLGSGYILGATCHNDIDLAKIAAPHADYLALGAVFPSKTKPQAIQVSLNTFAAVKLYGRPVVAIGGLTLQNCHPVLDAGADALAVVHGLFDEADIRGTTQTWLQQIRSHMASRS